MSIYLRGKSWYYDFYLRGRRYTGSLGPIPKTAAKHAVSKLKTDLLTTGLLPKAPK